ncbi:unnamed protein product [Oppiella nova]|uniref:Uncharacterized protein n=1 Tax=Oppiella nova TaxID=334625 RepID=A0A7R9L8U0_9ACAR|nr:unnamed protein product [Oppiella nova]CAG2159756.1 unnamed protein product [Oppiella nova]
MRLQLQNNSQNLKELARVAILTTVGIVMSMFSEAMHFFQFVSPIDFFFGTEWNPGFSTSDDIITQVPRALRDGSLGLGATKSETIRQVVLPAALPGPKPTQKVGESPAVFQERYVDWQTKMAGHIDRSLPDEQQQLSPEVRQLSDDLAAKGKVRLDNQDIYDPNLDVVLLRAQVGMVFQKPNPFPKSIFDNVAYGPKLHGLAKDKYDLEEIVENSLRKAAYFHLGDLIEVNSTEKVFTQPDHQLTEAYITGRFG